MGSVQMKSVPGWAIALLIGVLLLAGLGVQPASARQGEATPLDLPAMALTPDDLAAAGMPGFGIGVSVLGDAVTVADFLAAWRADPSGQVADAFAAAAPVRVHLLWIGKPVEAGNPNSATERFVFSHAFEFADDNAAAIGFTRLSQGWETDTAHAEPVSQTVGWAQAFFREAAVDPDTGTPYQRADLLFLRGRVVGGVSLEEGTGATPSQDEVIALAQRLEARIGQGLAGGAPGLGHTIARLAMPDGFAAVLPSDRYEAVGGVPIRRVGETDVELAERQAEYAATGITNYYFVGQPMRGLTDDPELLYLDHLRQFDTAERAAAWSQESITGLTNRGSTDVQRVESISLGDAVTLVSYVNAAGSPTWRVDVQHGPTLATLLFRGSVLADQEVVEAIAAAQLDCFVQGACLEPVGLSQEIQGEVEDRRGDTP